jgi:hypothetical protein
MSFSLAGLTAIGITASKLAVTGIVASKGHNMYLAGCDVLGAVDDYEVNQLTQAVKAQALQQELATATAPKKPIEHEHAKKDDSSMSAGTMLAIAGGLTLAVFATAAVIGRKK